MSIYYSLLTAVFALLFAMAMFSFVAKSPAGNERMREISASIHEGAQAFLFAEYRVLRSCFFCTGRLFWNGRGHQSQCAHS